MDDDELAAAAEVVSLAGGDPTDPADLERAIRIGLYARLLLAARLRRLGGYLAAEGRRAARRARNPWSVS